MQRRAPATGTLSPPPSSSSFTFVPISYLPAAPALSSSNNVDGLGTYTRTHTHLFLNLFLPLAPPSSLAPLLSQTRLPARCTWHLAPGRGTASLLGTLDQLGPFGLRPSTPTSTGDTPPHVSRLSPPCPRGPCAHAHTRGDAWPRPAYRAVMRRSASTRLPLGRRLRAHRGGSGGPEASRCCCSFLQDAYPSSSRLVGGLRASLAACVRGALRRDDIRHLLLLGSGSHVLRIALHTGMYSLHFSLHPHAPYITCYRYPRRSFFRSRSLFEDIPRRAIHVWTVNAFCLDYASDGCRLFSARMWPDAACASAWCGFIHLWAMTHR